MISCPVVLATGLIVALFPSRLEEASPRKSLIYQEFATSSITSRERKLLIALVYFSFDLFPP